VREVGSGGGMMWDGEGGREGVVGEWRVVWAEEGLS